MNWRCCPSKYVTWRLANILSRWYALEPELRDINVAGVQMRCELGQKEANLSAIEKWTVKAEKNHAELVCFPEMSITGFYCAGVDSRLNGDQVFSEVRRIAEAVPDGQSVKVISSLAKQLGIFI